MAVFGILFRTLAAALILTPLIQAAILTHCSFTRRNDVCDWSHGDGNFNWSQRINGTTPSLYTGPPGDVSEYLGEGEGGGYLFIEASGKRENTSCRIRSPQLSLALGSSVCVSFYTHMMGEGTGEVRLEQSTPTGGSGAIFKRVGDHDNEWKQVKVRLEVTEPSFQLDIVGVVGKTLYGDASIDDVRVETCGRFTPDYSSYKLVSVSTPWVEYPPGPKPVTGTKAFTCSFQDSRCGFSQATDDDFDWWRRDGETETDYTGPNSGHTSGLSTDRYMLAESSAPQKAGDRARLVSPFFLPSEDNQFCLEFYYNMHGEGMGSLEISTRGWQCDNSSDCAAGVPVSIFSVKGDQGKQWHLRQQRFLAVDQSRKYHTVEFEAILGNGSAPSFRSDIAIDDVTIFSCNSDYVFTVPEIPPLPYPDGCASPVAVTSANGHIASGRNYPDGSYESNMKCRWSIATTNSDKALLVQFDPEFFVEASERCEFDFVRVFDGLNERATEVFGPCEPTIFPFKGPYCGSYAPANYTSKTSKVTVEFCTDQRNERPGFFITWNETEKVAASRIASCPGDITNPLPGHSVTINTGLFELEDSADCSRDYLEIAETCKGTATRYCGHRGPVQYVSECNEVVVKFVTDSSDVAKGFQIAAHGSPCPRGNFYCGTPTHLHPEAKVSRLRLDCAPNNPTSHDEEDKVCQNLYTCGVEAPAVDVPSDLGWKPTATHPWHVAILSRTRRLACSGTLIATNWIVTSAQCVNRFQRKDDMILLLDAPVLNFEVWPSGSEVIPDSIIIHPQFSADTIRNDIALIRFTSPSGQNARMPVCFSDADDSYLRNGTAVTLVGYAHIEKPTKSDRANNEPNRNVTVFSNVLGVEMLTRSYCNSKSENALTDGMICTSSSACETDGDLGAPLVVLRRGSYQLVGVYSFSTSECRRSYNPRLTPAIYTRIKTYATWILDVLAGNTGHNTSG
ncbi:putative MAM and LDL-receptor class A domain-containing protein 1 [Hypsibius exemplaris]|uniref:MAM and LDL-receptor class A domain-containing protein 1 n=1 Tax=Hypsibius exemplaris TaxID=2072580 RepID=A0A1W0WPR4_HYPEX|nr:putative MAM and LDL-receptor class A domain-containing protein 1 [Hypsibius exemplaris]